MSKWSWYALLGSVLLAVVIVAGGLGVIGMTHGMTQGAPQTTSAPPSQSSAVVDPGTALGGTPAPNFALTDQFGRSVTLHQFRGKVVLLAFTDSQCTTICPLTSQSMLEALGMLGPAAAHVQLLGVNANPQANTVADARAYSVAHGLEEKWLFLTGSDAQLASVWKAYHIYVQIQQGNIDHTPALYVIDAQGCEQRLFMTDPQYGIVGDEAAAIASATAPLLPGQVHISATAPSAPQVTTTQSVTLPLALPMNGGPAVKLGPGAAQLTFFFASWAPGIQQQLGELNSVAQMHGVRLVAVDIGSTEPSPQTLGALLRQGGGSYAYPIAVDANGDVADAYQVQDIPWFTLTSPNGKVVWTHDGWLAPATLQAAVRKALGS